MMTPIQRVTRYQLLLSEIEKSFRLAEHDEYVLDDLKEALDIAHEVAEYANNMMIAGRIRGYHVSLL